jgi:hypothetical protein
MKKGIMNIIAAILVSVTFLTGAIAAVSSNTANEPFRTVSTTVRDTQGDMTTRIVWRWIDGEVVRVEIEIPIPVPKCCSCDTSQFSASRISRFCDNARRWVRNAKFRGGELCDSCTNARFEMNPIHNEWRLINQTPTRPEPFEPHGLHEHLESIPSVEFRVRHNTDTMLSEEELEELGLVIPMGIMTQIQEQQSNGSSRNIGNSTATYARLLDCGNFAIGATGHQVTASIIAGEMWRKTEQTNFNLHPAWVTGARGVSLATTPNENLIAADMFEDTFTGPVGVVNRQFIENGGLELGAEAMPVGQPQVGMATLRATTDNSGIPRDFIIYIFGTTGDMWSNNVVNAVNFIVLQGQCDVLDSGNGVGLSGMSGSPIIQDGKFVAVLGYTRSRRNPDNDEEFLYQFSSGFFAEEQILRHNEVLERHLST